MKKVLMILAILALICPTSFGQSMLKVRIADSSQFNISLDGRYFNKRGTSITVGDLPPGGHYLRIFALHLDRRGRGHEETIYEGRLKTHEGLATLVVYDPNSDQINIDEQDMSAFPTTHAMHPMRPMHNNGQRFRDQDYERTENSGNGAPQPYQAPAATGTVTDNKMNDLKTSVAAKPTDIEKTNLLKDELKNDKLTTAQVGVIMDWFIFESSKVDFAKWAYSITVDKEYFTDLENKFQYKASQDDLDQFIKTTK